MELTAWLHEFNRILLTDFDNRDDDLFIQIIIIERYLSAFGHLPDDPKKYHKIQNGLVFYQTEIVPAIGPFPKNEAKPMDSEQ